MTKLNVKGLCDTYGREEMQLRLTSPTGVANALVVREESNESPSEGDNTVCDASLNRPAGSGEFSIVLEWVASGAFASTTACSSGFLGFIKRRRINTRRVCQADDGRFDDEHKKIILA
ncbi:uncharacterized protein MONBRDRAFT_4842 [Monosiga brevicollis MX1]|uniref:Uncharacterized protein n=1 Tax=Monosiga brevicollis TaxID=81824 RepID=A9UP41_MONBE|nr:uncharacterized protein MONBRDRAFT_4842 [Monosiga brevicollis MX1]EDQ92355.1 predicted protein [Monosiga brevicollis MX1]|eukprot:XP_001742117.1 hypothetical protein [Monosiga brevicollis MX1]